MSKSQEWPFLSSQAQSFSYQVVLPRRLLWLGTFLQGLLCTHYFLAHIWLVKSFISQGHKLQWQLLGKLGPFVSCSFPPYPPPLIKPAVWEFSKAETKRTPTLSNWDVGKVKKQPPCMYLLQLNWLLDISDNSFFLFPFSFSLFFFKAALWLMAAVMCWHFSFSHTPRPC